MKYFILLCFVFVFPSLCMSQNVCTFSCDTILGLSCYKGVIFNKTYIANIKFEDSIERYTPSNEDVKSVNKIIIEINTVFSGRRNKKNKIINKYSTQYLGYINKRGEKIVLIQYLKAKNSKQFLKYYPNFEKDFIIGFGLFYQKNTIVFAVNLNNKTVALW